MKFFSVLSLCLLLCFSALAQKDAPVAGHAALLIDLLKKDYQSVDPDIRKNEVIKDRSLVLGIFKTYLEDDALKNDTTASKAIKAADEKLIQYNRIKKLVETATAVGVSSNDKGRYGTLDNYVDNLESCRLEYDTSKSVADDLELQAVGLAYSARNNTFLYDMVELYRTKYQSLRLGFADRSSGVNYNTSLQKAIPFLGGNMSYEIINGLGEFLAKRIKEELVAYAMTNVKKYLENHKDKIPLEELHILLPKTVAYLKSFKPEQLGTFQIDLKGYIQNDLNSILDNAYQLRNSSRVSSLLQRYPDLDFAFEAMLIIPNLSKVKYPVDYFTILSNSKNISQWKLSDNYTRKNMANLLSMSEMFARSLTLIENGEPKFAGLDFWNSYASEVNFYQLYAGFLHQQNLKYYKIEFAREGHKDVISLCGLLEKVVTSKKLTYKAKFESLIINMTKNAEHVYNTAVAIKKANKAGEHVGADTVYNFVKGVIDFSKQIISSQQSLLADISDDSTEKYEPTDQLARYFKVANVANEVVFALRKKNYANGIEQMLSLVDTLVPVRFTQEIPELVALVNLSPKMEFASWADAYKMLKIAKSDNLDPKIFDKVYIEFGKVEHWLSTHSDQVPTGYRGKIKNFREVLNAYRYGNAKPDNLVADVKQMKDMLDDPKFQLLVVSSYTQIPLRKVMEQLNTSMKKLKGTANGSEFRPFPDDVADQMTANIEAYAVEYYNVFIAGISTDTAPLKRRAEIMKADAISYTDKLLGQISPGLDPQIISIIHLVNGMAQAKDSEDVQKAIEAFALPVGSYSVKRQSAFNVSINSYSGILLGADFAQVDGKTRTAFSTGFTAPLGLSVSFGNFFSWKGSAFGLYIPLIDVGAVTRLRFDSKDNADVLPELSFKNIFSPGLYFTLGIPGSPFSLNLGGQYGPEFKQVGGTANFSSFRAGLGLTIDIPLFNLYTRPTSK
ncbi:hypothetical protein [Pedobacter sp. FW305-3-2-15-E-R2A2]|uniref:hypothetical protein n=1 Tax=Pedobacter sp. FW305-3-2-15-E-R2A2 TaxID=3140251 RepID=UPI00314065B5